jgi:hypothetical protein
MSNEEETAYIHGLLQLMKERPNGYYIADEGAPQLGFSDTDSFALMRRLESEGLATSNYATNMIITPHGLRIARGEQGYQGHLARQAQEQQRKDNREARSALGSFLSGWAGVAGLLLAGYTLWDAHQNASELETVRKQVRRLEQAHARDSLRAATQAGTPPLAAPEPAAHQHQASTPSTVDTSSTPAPTPAHKPPR